MAQPKISVGRTYKLAELCRMVDPEFDQPEVVAYEFSNGRQFTVNANDPYITLRAKEQLANNG